MSTTAIVLTIVVVIGVAIAGVVYSRRTVSIPNVAATEKSADFPPKPKWKPNVPVDLERTIQTFAYYTDQKRSFAIFTNGTCVLLPEGTPDATKEALKILDAVYNYHPDTNPQAMDDGHFLVSYSQPAYSIVFADEFAANRAYIEQNHLDGVVRDEVLVKPDQAPANFDDRFRIGLFGRARMFLDAQDPKVIRIWKPQ